MAIKKLIEVALPLDKINEESAREKSIRHGHPCTLHLYWARRPLATARAVIWSSLVDDPSSHPELFPTEEDQNKERQRLFKILEDLVLWNNLNNENVLESAQEEIKRWTNGNPPEFLDPFAGGGALPLEAQRLGLISHAHDLNPVAVMINKAMIEIPPKFANLPPIHPGATEGENYGRKWNGAEGLAEDVKYYGEWLKKETFERVGKLYPKVKVSGGRDETVIAWLWSRTVKCPNPACGCHTPLAKSFILASGTKKKIWVEPQVKGKEFEFIVHNSGKPSLDGTVNRKGAVCIFCGTPIDFPFIREESINNRIKSKLMAIVTESSGGRGYVSPDKLHSEIASVANGEVELGELAYYPGYINPTAYGFNKIESLFTKRQLETLSTFVDVLKNLDSKLKEDSRDSKRDVQEYSKAIRTYLSFAIDKLADYNSAICSWHNTRETLSHTFGMTGMSMRLDYCEANPFSESSGCFNNMVEMVEKVIKNLPATGSKGEVSQQDAQSDCNLRNLMISTDPPYYSNVPYADFADFFYVWMKKNLQDIYPQIFSTMLTPKSEELVADPYRHGSKDKAAEHFESGMLEACKQMYLYAREDIPVTIYYAYKQSDTIKDGEETQVSSSGWETMLSAIVKAGFAITGTWPVRTELANRSRGIGANALASSIVLVCRKRPENAPTTTRRNFIQELKRELKSSLQKLQSSNIAPVDMAQSAIGPGMGVFSKYTQVLEADGTPMSVRSALQIINQELDLYFNEQDGELDSNSRFCVDFYTQYGFNDAKFGDADTLARAKNTSVATLQSKGVFMAEKGVAHLVDRDKLPEKVDYADNMVWLFTQRLTRAMSTGGIKACATLIHNVHTSLPEQAKALAYRLHSIAERKGWQDEAFAYNSLVIAWTDIQMAAANIHEHEKDQIEMDI